MDDLRIPRTDIREPVFITRPRPTSSRTTGCKNNFKDTRWSAFIKMRLQ